MEIGKTTILPKPKEYRLCPYCDKTDKDFDFVIQGLCKECAETKTFECRACEKILKIDDFTPLGVCEECADADERKQINDL